MVVKPGNVRMAGSNSLQGDLDRAIHEASRVRPENDWRPWGGLQEHGASVEKTAGGEWSLCV